MEMGELLAVHVSSTGKWENYWPLSSRADREMEELLVVHVSSIEKW